MKKEQISLVVVDDHPKARKNISNLLKAAADIVIVGEAATGAQAIDLALTKKPDIMLLDIELPDLRGTAVMHRLNKLMPDLKVLAVSSYKDRQLISGMLENGASGYLVKDEAPNLLISAIRSVFNNRHEWMGKFQKEEKSISKFDQTLTKNEANIMMKLSADDPMNVIAMDLGIKEEQVNEYLVLLKKKYKAKSLSELKKIARQIYSDFKNNYPQS